MVQQEQIVTGKEFKLYVKNGVYPISFSGTVVILDSVMKQSDSVLYKFSIRNNNIVLVNSKEYGASWYLENVA
jgi:hypothetical protein